MERNYGHNKGNSYLNNYLSRKPKPGRNMKRIDKRTIEKVYMQFIASSVICLIVIIISNFNAPFISSTVKGVKWVVSADYDFKTAVYSFRNNVLPVINNRFKEVSNNTGSTDKQSDEGSTTFANKTLMLMPLEGVITSKFGMRDDPITHQKVQHYGVDISGEKGKPIKCPSDGVVIKVDESKSMGKSVRIRHSGGIETVYGHCSEILVSENQWVKQGDYIAKVGDTGMVTASHLHFEVFKDGKQVDPLSVLIDVKEPE